MRIADRVWVITGAGNGIGRELAREVLVRGGRAAAVDLRAESLEDTAAELDAGDRLSTHVVDVTDRAAVEALPDQVLAAHGSIDAVINNAGIIQPFVPVAELDQATIDRVLDVNLMGTLFMVRAFLPHLLQRPEAHLANVSSMGGYFPFPGQTIYGASKAAVKLLTEGLYAELLDTNVGVSIILPGAVATSITENSGVTAPMSDAKGFPMTSARDAARIMLDGIERNRLHIYVGRDARLLSLAIRIAPRRAIGVVQKQMKKLMSAETKPGNVPTRA